MMTIIIVCSRCLPAREAYPNAGSFSLSACLYRAAHKYQPVEEKKNVQILRCKI